MLTVIVITCSFGGFGMSHLQILPAMAKDTLTVGAAGVGLLYLASGIGSLIGNVIRYVLYLPIDVDQCGAVRAVLDRFRLVRLVLVLLGDVLTGGNLRSRSSLAIPIHYTSVRITF